jgi:predicted O-methyltransferase YrrM
MNSLIRNLVRLIFVERVRSRIRKLERNCRSLGDYFDLIQDFDDQLLPIDISPGQKKSEILSLLMKASKQGLRSVAEIGTCRGGTYYLLCKASEDAATIITLDIELPLWRKRLVKSFAGPRQTAIAIKGDSHQQGTINLVRRLVQGGLDLLFIDGDHSYKGVRKDFLGYSHLVKKGGWIAFHDVVPDFYSRYGIRMGGWTGGVPKFWDEVKRKYKHFEIVDNPRQDGAGIGVLVWK